MKLGKHMEVDEARVGRLVHDNHLGELMDLLDPYGKVILTNWPACPKGHWEVTISGYAPTWVRETREEAVAFALAWLETR